MSFCPRQALQERYPSSDFSIYFRHLDTRRTVDGVDTNRHHVCPRAQFPEHAEQPDNLITLSVEDHAIAHALLEKACGIKSPQTIFFELQRSGASMGGRASCSNHEHQVHAGRAGGSSTSATKVAASRVNFAIAGRAGGHVVGLQHKKNGTGIFEAKYHTTEHCTRAGSLGGVIGTHVRWHVARNVVNSNCVFCVGV